ncbi:hypothetical protein BH10PLA2_BH10PLA2_11650 [soil metagenome]
MAAASEWFSISSALDLLPVAFEESRLAKGSSDECVWESWQQAGCFLLSDNRNADSSDSLEVVSSSQSLYAIHYFAGFAGFAGSLFALSDT